MIKRILDINKLISKKSFFLLGPRQTGKTTLLNSFTDDECLKIDLLDPDMGLNLLQKPSHLIEIINGHNFGKDKNKKKTSHKIIIIDEIQKLPILLDIVHSLIEKDPSFRFILTGSSARKLRKTGTNLLGGRAGQLFLHPFVTAEIFKLEKIPVKKLNKILLWGLIPSVYTSSDSQDRLKDYVNIYLKEEIQAEAISRNLSAFSRFLKTAALTNTEQLNYDKIGNDSQVSPRTIKDYYQVLDDTLIGQKLDPYHPTVSRKFVSTPKFYFFDLGVVSALIGRKELVEGTIDYGKAVEHLIYCELRAYKDYKSNEAELYYWRTQTQKEVDFVVVNEGLVFAIEVKASKQFRPEHASGLIALAQETKLAKKIVVNLEKIKRKIDGDIFIYPLFTFLEELWAGEIF